MLSFSPYHIFQGSKGVCSDTEYPHYFCLSFTGKELDAETGYSYFGASYYDPATLAAWLSVDPMADKYPSISPYAYCAWIPLKLVDPDGKDVWEINNQGELIWKQASNNDEFYKIDEKGNRVEGNGNSLVFNQKIVTGQLSLNNGDKKQIKYLQVDNDKNAKTIFEFASNGWQKESIEFGWAKVKNDNCETNMIGFSAGDATTSANSTLFYNGYEITNATHNHPDELFGPSNADIDFSQKVQQTFPNATFSVYNIDGSYTSYDKNTPKQKIMELPNIQIYGTK